MFVDQLLDRDDIRFGFEPLQYHEFRMQIDRKRIVQIQHVGDSSGHSGSKVFSGIPEYQQDAARHILTAVIAYSLDHGGHSRIPYSKAFTGSAGSEKLSACSAVQASVADN